MDHRHCVAQCFLASPEKALLLFLRQLGAAFLIARPIDFARP
jgi:hypothetical protein